MLLGKAREQSYTRVECSQEGWETRELAREAHGPLAGCIVSYIQQFGLSLGAQGVMIPTALPLTHYLSH